MEINHQTILWFDTVETNMANIEKWGDSAALRLPKNILKILSLNIGDRVTIVQKGNALVIEPYKPSLDYLLAKITPQNRHSELFKDFAGNEIM